MIWTECLVTVANKAWGDTTRIGISDSTFQRSHRWIDTEVSVGYANLIKLRNTRFIILFDDLKNLSGRWLAETFRNGLAIARNFGDSEEPDWQVHVYPLIMLPWFQKKYRQEPQINDPILFVDGKLLEWTKEVCYVCPKMLDRSMTTCHSFHSSCDYPFFTDKELPPEKWFDAHPLLREKLAEHEYRPAKELECSGPFQAFSIVNLTTSPDKMAKFKKERSDRSRTAALTRHVKAVACSQCAVKDYCFSCRGGGYYCKGPMLQEDYDYLHKGCKPWMAHALMLTRTASIDSKKVECWQRARSNAYVLCPNLGVPTHDSKWNSGYKNDKRQVMLMRPVGDNPRISMPYRYLCEILNIRPVKAWRDLPPEYKEAKALRAAAYGLSNKDIHRQMSVRCGFSYTDFELTEVTVDAQLNVRLAYNNNRRNHERRKHLGTSAFYEDILTLPGFGADGTEYTPRREKENELFREAVFEHRLNVTMEEVREAGIKYADESSRLAWLSERSKERCKRRRFSKRRTNSTAGVAVTQP